jgi:glycolate oxidase FAD binding subunit
VAIATLTQEPALQALIEQVQRARASGAALRIRGGGSKDFYGEPAQGEVLDARTLAGIASYEPTELVVTARCGTKLDELEARLAAHGQCLAFEPPRLAPGSTVGGIVAAGLAGPARASAGSVRDHVLGAVLLDGHGEVLTFGGQVMKNVAGYDVSRLLAGSMGVLGVILEVSLKVLPVARSEATLRFECDQASALARLAEWAALPLPLNASAWWDGNLIVRLRGAASAVRSAASRLGGDAIAQELALPFWEGLRDQRDEFFVGARAAVAGGASLWRIALPPTAPPLELPGTPLVEWHGGQRWLASDLPAEQIRAAAARHGGHATLYVGADKSPGVLTPLTAPLARNHERVKAAFDQAGIFNPGRGYPGH